MDEAFLSLSKVLQNLHPSSVSFSDQEAGVLTYITGLEIESPVELDVTRGPDGALMIGSTPPLYPLMTTVSPVFHTMRFTLKLDADGTNG